MKKLTCIIALAALTGCATQTFHVQNGSSTAPSKQTMQPFFVYGIGQTQEMNAAEICGGADKIAKVEVIQNFLDGVLGVVTWGIYTPRTAKVFCMK